MIYPYWCPTQVSSYRPSLLHRKTSPYFVGDVAGVSVCLARLVADYVKVEEGIAIIIVFVLDMRCSYPILSKALGIWQDAVDS